MSTNPLHVRNRPLHLLVTAGPTREKIDDVRDWGNIFSGQTGLDIALAFLDLGNVTLLTSNRAHAAQFDGYSGKAGMLGAENFSTHAELHALLTERMTDPDSPVDVVAMTAAVADYRPEGVFRIVERRADAHAAGKEVWVVENVDAPKVKSTYDQIAVAGVRTLKLVDLFRTTWGYKGLLIKFKLEVGLTEAQLIEVASASRVASGADLMVANTLAMARPADGSEGSALILGDGQPQRVTRGQLAPQLVDHVRSAYRP